MGVRKGEITNCEHKERKHYAKGMCRNCYIKYRYQNDIEFRERKKEKSRIAVKKWYKKKMEENPSWNAKKQKEYRKKYPEKFNYIMARYYIKRLSKEKVNELLKELNIVENKVDGNKKNKEVENDESLLR